MDTDTKEYLQEAYNSITWGSVEEKALLDTPHKVHGNPFERHRAEETAPKAAQAVEAYDTAIEELDEAVSSFKNAAKQAAEDLPEDLHDGTTIKYESRRKDHSARAAPAFGVVAAVMAEDVERYLTGAVGDLNGAVDVDRAKRERADTDSIIYNNGQYEKWKDELRSDISFMLLDNVYAEGHSPDDEAEYGGWQGQLIRSARDNGVMGAYDEIIDQREDVATAEETALTAIEEAFSQDRGFVDRLLGR
ncbi:MAG: hypothetical protein SVU32_04195 [Candidatus Nanohaloarchaea archaeon]|nr:hypothetical protein [Candidatus Nanohaloarchaea archaeon]